MRAVSRARRIGALTGLGLLAVPLAAPASGPTAKDRSVLEQQLNPATVKLLAPEVRATTGGPEVNGEFGKPFAEPTVNGQRSDAKCVESEAPNKGALQEKALTCKPAAGTLAVLPDGKVFFWDALEGTENNQYSIVTEGGTTFTNDSARRLDLGAGNTNPTWDTPDAFDGGANPNGTGKEGALIPGAETSEPYNAGALFGSHQAFLPDGRLLVQGGTDYSLDPGVDGIPFGAVELTGLKATRVYDFKTNKFKQVTDTNSRRWYPTLVSTGDEQVLDFSGVGKLIKPIYPEDPSKSGTNVKQVEKYDPATNKWSMYPPAADYDLPLYPRMHLLPNGNAFYNASGQVFNPFGQSTGQNDWNFYASFDPKAGRWSRHGLANTSTPLAPGFRGSASSTLLPLRPDADGQYRKVEMLMAGGIVGTTPGTYFATNQSNITSVDTSGGKEKVTDKATGPLNQSRWFGQQIQLPNGKVMMFSGADVDEVLGPGTERARQQAEIFDPATNKWTPVATANNPRTYHNSAALLPSGEVLVGGHAPISTLYLNNTTLPGGFAPHDGRDPSFEIYKPPYMFCKDRPEITSAPDALGFGRTMDFQVKGDASKIESVSLVRNSAITHIIDADQRTVMLPVVGRNGSTVTVRTPPDGNVAPAGPYMLFANGKGCGGGAPSVAKSLMVSTDSKAVDRAEVKSGLKSAPKARSCASKRAFTLNIRKGFKKRFRSATVTVNGKKVKTLKRSQKRFNVSLKGQPKRVTVVKIKMRLRGGRTVTDTRVYRPCIPGPANKNKGKNKNRK
ncbi:MAG: hypothetical protein AVDCRST_MAG54-412 [uncultured Actinomycetospora sp.]|uniref:Uncharacterized protein n=1 Tax=uncultured Actinomycetospora sp. TaxID=1135996 RepID=A0A6J4HBI7_9PSEU|nr:MAG: hypothetical protein AVDCRST_MAG54-412 [uncultured Actinomycetospora sp.]